MIHNFFILAQHRRDTFIPMMTIPPMATPIPDTTMTTDISIDLDDSDSEDEIFMGQPITMKEVKRISTLET